jgi:hypothetical protein
VLDVGGDAGTAVADAADLGAGGTCPRLLEPALDEDLDVVVELVAAPGQELDAVVGHRVVARRDHHAHVGVEESGEEGGTWRGNDTQPVHVDAGGGEAGHHSRLEELAGSPGVTSHDRGGPLVGERAGLAEHVGSRDRQVERELGGQVAVGEASHPIGAEDAAHGGGISAWSTGEPYGPS